MTICIVQAALGGNWKDEFSILLVFGVFKMTEQNIYYFSGIPTIFACVDCKVISDYLEVVKSWFCCIKCKGWILKFGVGEGKCFETMSEDGGFGK